MNNLYGSRLVEAATGGKGGGGAKLSRSAQKLIEGYRRLEVEHKKFLSAASAEIEQFDKFYNLFKRLLMKTSARNQFFGKVARIVKGAVNAEVELKLSADDKIIAIVTKEGLEDLGLKVGREAWALVKASWVILAEDHGDLKLSARNCLRGTVTRVVRGTVNSHVTLALSGGTAVSAIITNASLHKMGLKNGSPVCAVFKASSVILGVSM
ncbi:MAG: TOBE domain-containing protein [Alphaproteobacteria bacterium]